MSSQLKEILATRTARGFEFGEIRSTKDDLVSVSIDKKHNNVIVFNPEKSDFVTIYGNEVPFVAECLLCVSRTHSEFKALESGEYELDLEDPEDLSLYKKYLEDFKKSMSRSTSTYEIEVEANPNSDFLTLEDLEDLDSIDIPLSQAIQLAQFMLMSYSELR